jgi:hypothetical protein
LPSYEENMAEQALALYDEEQIKRWNEIAETLKKSAETRRRKRTPDSKKRNREGGEGKTFTYVDRPDYQIWLDENFPGWTIEEFKCWTERAKNSNTVLVDGTPTTSIQDSPILFCVSFMLIVIEQGMAKRRVPCIGSTPVSDKELSKSSSYGLRLKYKIAMTEAYKTGCEWLGAFFDLRADDEARAEASKPPTKEQFDKFISLLDQVPVEHKDRVTKSWKTQNSTSAAPFLIGLEKKVKDANK